MFFVLRENGMCGKKGFLSLIENHDVFKELEMPVYSIQLGWQKAHLSVHYLE